MVERTVRVGTQVAPAWRLLVAADRRETVEAIGRFNVSVQPFHLDQGSHP